MMPRTDFEFCLEHQDELVEEVRQSWNELVTPQLMDAYLTGSSEWKNGRPSRIGYFVGAHIVNSVLLATGLDIGTLSKMPTAEIMELFSRGAS